MFITNKEQKPVNIRSLTNNPMVINKRCSYIEGIEGDPLYVFRAVKSEILKGCKLITHPLTGSIRPDISPYKTVMISDSTGNFDYEGLRIIENAIEYTESLYSNSLRHKWDEASLKDFQFVDYDLIKGFIDHEHE
ncbi:MAG: GrdX family protein [Clostridiaceae bacterium]|nr:GrdX family protein [Clostridiaceae bacterium]